MADHAKPILTDNYTDVLSQIRGRFEDQAKGFDPANTTATNISTGTIRWNSAEKKFQKWSGTAWGDLTDNYVLSGATFSTGTANAVAYLNGSKVLTTGSALTFDGTNFATTGKVTAAGTVLSAFGAGTSGTNLELGFDGTQSIVQSYNRTGSAYAPLWLEGSYTRFGSGGSEQMRLTSTGLGIGTSSPGYKLDVTGTARIGTAIFDTSGNLGLGVVPSAWSASAKAIQFGAYGAVYQNASGYPELAFNVFQNASNSYIYRNTDVATRYSQTNGAHQWFTAPSGTAGSTISFTQAMTLNANGNLLIGNTNGTSRITASGVIESTTGGFKFPDGTTQTTAAVSATSANVGSAIAGQGVGAVGTYAMMRNNTGSAVSPGSTVSVSVSVELIYANAAGATAGFSPVGTTWQCMGYAAANTATPAERTTLWLRIS